MFYPLCSTLLRVQLHLRLSLSLFISHLCLSRILFISHFFSFFRFLLFFFFFFLMIRPPPISPLFPYTTLFRSRFWREVLRSPAQCRRKIFAHPHAKLQLSNDSRLHPQHASFHHQQPHAACHCLRRRSLSRFQRSEEHTSELQSQSNLVCRLLLE